MRKLEIKANPDKVIAVEVMEEAILKIASSMEAIRKTRISRKMLVALIHDDTRLTKGNIETVLESLESLEKRYLRPNVR